MEHSKWLIFSCIVATVILTGCSDDNNNVVSGPPPGPEVAEAHLEDTLDTIVDPLMDFRDFYIALLALLPPVDEVTCPDTSTWCNLGSVSCHATSSPQLVFTFDSCTLTIPNASISLDGRLSVRPEGISRADLDLSINGSVELHGHVEVEGVPTDQGCLVRWYITENESPGLFSRTMEANLQPFCPGEYPSAASDATIWVDEDQPSVSDWVMSLSFNGTSTGSAFVTDQDVPTAECSFDLDTHEATCSEPS